MVTNLITEYLGSVLTGHLLDNGYKVTCLDNLRYHQKSPMIYVHDPDFEFKGTQIMLVKDKF